MRKVSIGKFLVWLSEVALSFNSQRELECTAILRGTIPILGFGKEIFSKFLRKRQ